MNGADAIAEILKREGVEFLSVFPAQEMIDAVAKIEVRPVLCRQERVGMAIADGFSRTTSGRKLGVFAMQQGPGSENAYPGAAQAYADNVPILLIAGSDYSNMTYKTGVFEVAKHYEGITKWSAVINQIDRIPEFLRRAFYQLRTGRGGPVLLEVPREIWGQEYPGELEYSPVGGNLYAPDPADVREVASVLLAAESPIIHAGQGCLYADAWDELQEAAELLQAPVMTTLPGKSAFPENHPLSLGAASTSTTMQVARFLDRADVVFGIGCSFTPTGYGRAIPPGKVIIHSTNDPTAVNKNYKTDHALLGDAKLVLQALIEEVKAQSGGVGRKNDRDVAPEVAALKKEWLDDWMPQLTSDEVPINQYRIIWDLLHNVDRANTIVTHDAGSPREQIVPFWETVAPHTYMGWGKSTQLGYGLGITMGAKLAEPDKLCVNMMGDAAIGMVGMDIETAVRNKIGILTIVFNNQVMAIERGHMPYSAEMYDALAQYGDYEKLASALGAWSMKVEKPDDFVPALKSAIEVTRTGRPALLDCIVKEGYEFSQFP